MYVARIHVVRCTAFSDAIAGCKAYDRLLRYSKGKLSSVEAQSARILGCREFVPASVSRTAASYEQIVWHRWPAHEDCK